MFKKLLLALTTIAAARVHALVFPVPYSGAGESIHSSLQLENINNLGRSEHL
jgi:hypothetical protein